MVLNNSRREGDRCGDYESWWRDKDAVCQRAKAQGFAILGPANNNELERKISDLELARWAYNDLEFRRIMSFGELGGWLEDLKRERHELYSLFIKIYETSKKLKI